MTRGSYEGEDSNIAVDGIDTREIRTLDDRGLGFFDQTVRYF